MSTIKFNNSARNLTNRSTVEIRREGDVVGTFAPEVWESVQRSEVTGDVVVRTARPINGSDLFVYPSNQFGLIETFLTSTPK